MSLIGKILPKKEAKEYFITIGIEEHRISATIASISEKQVTIVGTGESEYRESGNEVEAADIAVSTAERSLPENVFIQKVIFGLPVNFLDQGKIKPEYLTRIKKLSKELDLKPHGFVEYPQALSYYFEKKEELPPTLLLLRIGRDILTLSLLRIGKIEKNIIIKRSSSFNVDFESTLSHFSSEILPSRIIIYDEVKGIQLEELREELLRFPWHKHASFLHTPKIEILEDGAINTALVEAAASSLVKEFLMDEKTTEGIKDDTLITGKAEGEKEEVETFGFVKSEDFTLIQTKLIETQQAQDSYIKESKKKIDERKNADHQKPIIPKLPSINFSLPHFSIHLFTLLSIIGTLLFIVILSLFLFWYYPKAIVNLLVYPLSTSQKFDVVFTTGPTHIKAGKNIILARTISIEESGSKTIPTSGKMKIGEPAKGEVTIYNKTTANKLFSKGTVLTNGQLRFTLDEDINVASASDTGEGLTFGKTTAKITSADIGPESNLTVNSIFAFKDFPQTSFYAKNINALSGGTSRDVSSVSKDDQDKLLKLLTEELEKTAKQDIVQKIKTEEKILDNSITSSIINKKFSNDINTEAKEISLTLTLKNNALIYTNSDLEAYTKPDLFSAPSGFTLDRNKISVVLEQTKIDKNGDVTAETKVTASFTPDIDKNNIGSRIRGKSFHEATRYLSTIANIGGAEIIQEKPFPLFNNRLPLLSNNININIISR